MDKKLYTDKSYIIVPSANKLLKFVNGVDTFDNLIVGVGFDESGLEEIAVTEITREDLQVETVIPEDLADLKQLKINATPNALKKWCYEHPHTIDNRQYVLSEDEYLRLGASYSYHQMSEGTIELYLAPMGAPTESVTYEDFVKFMLFISRFLRLNKDVVSEYIESVNASGTFEEIEALTIAFIAPEEIITE